MSNRRWGVFSPSLAVGAGLGAAMAALIPATVVIVLEMTANHAMAAPVMMASLIGFSVSRMIGAPAIYHALAHRYLPKPAASAAPAIPPQS